MSDLADRRGIETAVYGPAEDSALLAGAVAGTLTGRERVADVGTGSGYVADRIATVTGATVIGTDLNPFACRAADRRGVAVVRTDLLRTFRPGVFDVVVCNPPYLPAAAGRPASGWFDVAVNGGESGRDVIDRLLADVGRVLTPAGVVYLLVSTLTGIEAVVEAAGESGFHAAAVADASFAGETLTVLRLFR